SAERLAEQPGREEHRDDRKQDELYEVAEAGQRLSTKRNSEKTATEPPTHRNTRATQVLSRDGTTQRSPDTSEMRNRRIAPVPMETALRLAGGTGGKPLISTVASAKQSAAPRTAATASRGVVPS